MAEWTADEVRLRLERTPFFDAAMGDTHNLRQLLAERDALVRYVRADFAEKLAVVDFNPVLAPLRKAANEAWQAISESTRKEIEDES
jgi:hypothetical protein